MAKDNKTVYVGSGIISTVWILATLVLFINWFVKSIPSWIIDSCNIIFIIGIIIPAVVVVGFLFVVLLAVFIDHRRR